MQIPFNGDVERANRSRILVIADESGLRTALECIARTSGHFFEHASSAAEGLVKMCECRPDVVVLDLATPGLGYGRFRAAQGADHPLTAARAVVFSTSESTTADAVEQSLVLRGPLDERTIMGAIEHVVRRSTAEPRVGWTRKPGDSAAFQMYSQELAHEINNPLTYVLLQLSHALRLLPSLLADANRSDFDQVDALIRSCLEGAERIRDITAGITRQHLSPPLNLVDIRDVIGAAVRLVGSETGFRAQLVTEYIEPPLVMANKGLLGQVLLNLIVNALHAVAASDRRVQLIRVRATADKKGDLIVDVSDTGVGVPAHLLTRIFEPYFSTRRQGQGAGLGLSTSQRIVGSLGGHLSVESIEGEGATFRISLPAARAHRRC